MDYIRPRKTKGSLRRIKRKIVQRKRIERSFISNHEPGTVRSARFFSVPEFTVGQGKSLTGKKRNDK